MVAFVGTSLATVAAATAQAPAAARAVPATHLPSGITVKDSTGKTLAATSTVVPVVFGGIDKTYSLGNCNVCHTGKSNTWTNRVMYGG